MEIIPQKMLADAFRKRKPELQQYMQTEYAIGTLNEEEALYFN
jgi:hypothetical protein